MEPSTRRSQPNLIHHTLNPLTSALPAPTHSTSRSTSYLAPRSVPPLSPSILSRSSSRTRLRPAHSRPIPASTSSPNTGAKGRSRRTAPAIEDEGWLVRTASHLAGQSLEEKGQSWLATRESSTSLVNAAAAVDLDADDEYDAYSPEFSRSRISTPVAARSRLHSRMNSRRGSMFSQNQQGLEEVGPDFVDLAEEDVENEEEEEVDEGEMRRVVMGREMGEREMRGRIGGEVVDVERKDTVAATDRKAIAEKRKRRKIGLGKGEEGKEKGEGEGDEKGGNEKGLGVTAPEGDVGILRDARWLLEVAKQIVL